MTSDIDELKRELDIVEVVSDYIKLERAGNNFRANCPFHADKTPSFYVSPSRQIFKCFGCGVGGDAIKFVSLYENISYVESAKQLAKRYGIRLRIKEESSENKKLYSVLEEVAQFYHAKLKENRRPLEYLKERGIDTSTIKRFMLGFSPSTEDLVRLLREHSAIDLYTKTGNLIKLEDGRYRDLFRNRVIIPIRDASGRVVGFGGRILEGDAPKYVNSPESDIFKKRELLFGLCEGISYLRDLKSALVVEGYFDVMALHQEGFRNAVATLGTSLGRDHAKALSRFVERVYLLFDGDQAGRRAMRLAIPHLLREDLEVIPVFLPEGTDPHDLVIKEGRQALKELLEGSTDIFSQLFGNIREGIDVENSIKDFTYYVSFLRDEIRAYTLLSELSKITKIPVDVLSSKMYKAPKVPEDEEDTKLSFTERVFLKGLLELKPQIDLEDLNLSSTAREYAQSIMREEYYHIPEEVINMKVTDLEEEFSASLEKLKIDIPDAEGVTPVGVRESMREFMRSHRGGLKPYSVRKWRGKLEN